VDEAIVVHAPPDRVWACLADRRLLGSWWPHMDLAVEPGGSFVERWTDDRGIERRTTGTVVTCSPPGELVLSWIDDGWPAPTRVEITIDADRDGRTRVRVRHLGWDALPGGADLVEPHRGGWRHHLANWAATAERPG
jgi:uncharacterized protein YndB with AHSA1/START domain